MNFNAENSLTKATRIYSGGRTISARNGAGPADFACTACKTACNFVPGGALGKMACDLVCDNTVC